MLRAITFGSMAGLALLTGAAVGIYFKLSKKAIARFMAFGSGVLICALTFGLMEEAFKHGGFDAVVLGFLAGGLVFIGADYLVHLKGGRLHHKHRILKNSAGANAKAITVGAILDEIPEAIALGVSIANGAALGILMVSAVVLSDFPEGISTVRGLKEEQFSNKRIFLMWLLVGIITVILTAVSFQYLAKVNPNSLGMLESFAAGAILAMLADSIMPEAYEEGGFSIGLLTVLGFLAAFIISRF